MTLGVLRVQPLRRCGTGPWPRPMLLLLWKGSTGTWTARHPFPLPLWKGPWCWIGPHRGLCKRTMGPPSSGSCGCHESGLPPSADPRPCSHCGRISGWSSGRFLVYSFISIDRLLLYSFRYIMSKVNTGSGPPHQHQNYHYLSQECHYYYSHVHRSFSPRMPNSFTRITSLQRLYFPWEVMGLRISGKAGDKDTIH